jgi:hypothetical protein
MKTFSVTSAAWLLSTAALFAQMKVEVVMDQNQFLPGEKIPVAVKIANRSGQELNLGVDNDWLTFSVESREGFVVEHAQEMSVTGEFDLGPSKVATKRVDLGSGFQFSKPGRYFVVATVRVKGWQSEFSSERKAFDVIGGAKLWEQEFGVPKSAETNAAHPEVRRYIVQQANYVEKLTLYVTVTEVEHGRVLTVLPLHTVVSFSQPECQLDRQSRLHVLCQTGARSFLHSVVSPDGNVVRRQTYDYTTRPRLRVDDAGNIAVSGGQLRETRHDIIPPDVAASIKAANETATPKP